jgi:TonB family protein
MIEVNIQSISRATLNADLFQVPATALKYQSCKKFQRASNEYGPDYFQIRSDSTGSVVLAGTLDEYGKVVEVEIQQSAGEKSDRLVRQALKEMRFSPAKCDGRRITSFFRFQMWFSRSLHPDSFHSFQW